MLKLLFAIVVVAQLCNNQSVDAARILAVIPTASYSHQIFYQQLWRELAIRGHDMVVITTDPTGEKLPNFKEIDVKETYAPTKELWTALIKESAFSLLVTNRLFELLNKAYVFQIKLPQIQSLIKNKTEHFDLVMVEHFPLIHLAFKHRFKCPMIGVISLDAFSVSHAVMGNPDHAVLYPAALLPFQENMNLFQRFTAFLFKMAFEVLTIFNRARLDEMTRENFGDDVPSILEIFDETDMLFTNANPLFAATRPLTPSTLNIAGIHLKKPKELPSDLKEFLDNAPDGVVYCSLGSNVKSKELSLDLRQIFINTLSALPYKVLWKFEDDDLPGKPNNVKIIKWAPQQDILRHPKVKLFITQGGIQSLEEALYAHVPMVVLPFLGDQEANAERVKLKGIGVALNPHTLTVDGFKSAILDVMESNVYRDTVKEFAERIQDDPMTPLEKAVWWTEYVLRHKGGKHLRGPRIPFWQFYYLDVLVFISGVLIVLLGLIFGVVKIMGYLVKNLICKRNKCSKNQEAKKKKN